jgi:hypothetical protein
MTFEELEQIVTGLAVSQARAVDAVAVLIETAQVLQAGQTQQAAAIDQLIDSQVQTFDRLEAVLDRVDVVVTRIDEMQSEVRGLQTETRRIVDRLSGLANDDD